MAHTELFCQIDDFCVSFESALQKSLIATDKKTRNRATSISLSEIMTIVILFHQSGYRFFKSYYCNMIQWFWKSAFPNLPSYNRMIELMPRCLQALCSFFHTVKGQCTEISLVDSTKIKVCDNRRINRHKVFKGLAERGKTSVGWFYGFKLHLIINNLGEIISLKITSGNVHDVSVVNALSKDIVGSLLGDKGYVSKKLAAELAQRGVRLVTSKRKNTKHSEEYSATEKQLLSKRGLIETVNDQLKNLHQIEHTRHRSVLNAMVNIMAGVVAYCLSPNKPSFKNMINY